MINFAQQDATDLTWSISLEKIQFCVKVPIFFQESQPRSEKLGRKFHKSP